MASNTLALNETAPAEPAAAEPSIGQKLFAGVDAVWRNLASLEPSELALNLGLSLMVIAGVAIAIWLLRRLLHSGIDALAAKGLASDRAAEPRKRAAGPRVARATWLLIRVSLVVAAFLVLLSIWGLDLLGWLATTGAGATLTRVVGVLVVAVALVEVAGHVVNRLLSVLSHRTDGGRRTAQVNTLGPLVRGVVQGFIIVVASLTILSELGVKIGPLLASAGVVGIAVGFGAQTLVKDFLTGLFLVVEDIVAVGDNVQIGDKTGTVEAMTLRTIRVRNMDGTLHILPYSEAQVISNRTKTFSAYVFDLSVAYETDIEHAFEVMRRVGAELEVDEAYRPKILQPLEILGVDQLGDSAVILKARFRTRPGEQWVVGRAYNKRIKEAFQAEGIEIPYPVQNIIVQPAQPDSPEPAAFPPGGDAARAPG